MNLIIKTVVLEKAVIKQVKDRMIKLSELARSIIDESTDKELKEHGKMKSTRITITTTQQKRLEKIKPHNLSKFINDRIKEKVK